MHFFPCHRVHTGCGNHRGIIYFFLPGHPVVFIKSKDKEIIYGFSQLHQDKIK